MGPETPECTISTTKKKDPSRCSVPASHVSRLMFRCNASLRCQRSLWWTIGTKRPYFRGSNGQQATSAIHNLPATRAPLGRLTRIPDRPPGGEKSCAELWRAFFRWWKLDNMSPPFRSGPLSSGPPVCLTSNTSSMIRFARSSSSKKSIAQSKT